MSDSGTVTSSCGAGFEIEFEAYCERDLIIINNISGNGPLYRIYMHDQTSPREEFVWHESDPHGDHSNPFPIQLTGASVTNLDGTKILYALIESCGCCKEIIVECPDVTTTTSTSTSTSTSTTTSSTTPPTSTTSTTPSPTTTSTTTPCCPPRGEWYWNRNSPPSTITGTSGVVGPLGTEGETGIGGPITPSMASVSMNPDTGIVTIPSGTWDVDVEDYDVNSDPVRYVVSANVYDKAFHGAPRKLKQNDLKEIIKLDNYKNLKV